jgi:neuropeptide Y receptor
LFVLNLAISDLTLCIFSIPFNAYKTLRHLWIFGGFLCKFAPFFQASNVFVSTFSITAIALDR